MKNVKTDKTKWANKPNWTPVSEKKINQPSQKQKVEDIAKSQKKQ